MSDADKTSSILAGLKAKYDKEIWATELAFSSGTRRCDFWVLHPHASKGYRAAAFEIKVSRADFKRDDPIKQREARLFSDEFWYVTPPGLIKPEEVPDWAGLTEFHGMDDTWPTFRPVIHAPRRDKDAPSWELVVSIIRNSGEVRRETDLLRQQIRHLEAQVKREAEARQREWRKRLEGALPSPHTEKEG